MARHGLLKIWMHAELVRSRLVKRDDRGAVTTETAIVTAIIGAAALALAGFIAGVVTGWQGEIPVVGG
jgi:hypothetical protein